MAILYQLLNVLNYQVHTLTGCYEIPTSEKKEPRMHIREVSGVYWHWNRTQVLSSWKQDQANGGDDD